jgi:hypothetical protein
MTFVITRCCGAGRRVAKNGSCCRARQWTDAAGNTRYAKLIDFGSDHSERAFARAALKAVRELNAKTPR